MIDPYDGTTGWTDEGRAVDVVYMNFSKAFDSVCHDILRGKLRERGLDEWTLTWIENYLNVRAKRVVISGTEYICVYICVYTYTLLHLFNLFLFQFLLAFFFFQQLLMALFQL